MLAKANIDYAARDVLSAMPPDNYAALRAALPDMGLPAEQSDVSTRWFGTVFIVDDHDIQTLSDAGIAVTLHRVKGLAYSGNAPRVTEAVRTGAPTVNVSVAGIGLLEIRHVTVEEDCCTDRLQDLLDNGWRILAVCPPNDSRRPTYVLGSPKEIR